MQIKIMNASQANIYTKNEDIQPCRVISITELGDSAELNENNPNISDILRLDFDDVEMGEVGAITNTDAKKIIDFVEQRKEGEEIVVHCGAGQSRSAGVAAALMKIYNGDDTEVFQNGRYTPNMTCYRKVIDAGHQRNLI